MLSVIDFICRLNYIFAFHTMSVITSTFLKKLPKILVMLSAGWDATKSWVFSEKRWMQDLHFANKCMRRCSKTMFLTDKLDGICINMEVIEQIKKFGGEGERRSCSPILRWCWIMNLSSVCDRWRNHNEILWELHNRMLFWALGSDASGVDHHKVGTCVIRRKSILGRTKSRLPRLLSYGSVPF